jgi:hypothetical protein
VDGYLSPSQSGFRPGRQTTDVVWTYRWLEACVKRYADEFHIMGIDMSKAFDSINREILLSTVKTLVGESEYRVIQYLLSDTVLKTRVQGKYGSTFATSIGTPQGDALSPVLFIVYLEHALRATRFMYHATAHFFMETEYGDDTDFISGNPHLNGIANAMLPSLMKPYNLQINQDKTEFIKMSEKLSNKKLGSILDSNLDIEYRINQSKRAFNQCWKIWNNKHIAQGTKVRMYNAFVKPIQTYNLGATAASNKFLDKLDSHHRKQLRCAIGLHFPHLISNTDMYKKTGSKRLTADISVQRIKFLGHALRRDQRMPAYVATERFFAVQQQCIDGRFKMYSANTVAKRLQGDLKKTQHPMETTEDLHKLRGVAEDRKIWQEEIVKRIEQKEAAEDIRLAAKEKERIEASKRKNNTAGTSVRQNDRRQRKRMRQDHLINTHPMRENSRDQQTITQPSPSRETCNNHSYGVDNLERETASHINIHKGTRRSGNHVLC